MFQSQTVLGGMGCGGAGRVELPCSFQLILIQFLAPFVLRNAALVHAWLLLEDDTAIHATPQVLFHPVTALTAQFISTCNSGNSDTKSFIYILNKNE